MENQIKEQLLDYAAHLSRKCEFRQSTNSKKKLYKPVALQALQALQAKQTKLANGAEQPYGFRALPTRENFALQNHVGNCLANILLIVDKLLKKNAKLLLISGCSSNKASNNKFQVQVKQSSLQKKSFFLQSKQSLQSKPYDSQPYLMQGKWINGACSNWSRLRQVAWNSYKLTQLRNTRSGTNTMYIENWVLEAESLFSGLQLTNSICSTGKKLAYRHKPDCVLLINPDLATVRECKSFNVPLCILSNKISFKTAFSYLESNQESSFLSYFILALLTT